MTKGYVKRGWLGLGGSRVRLEDALRRRLALVQDKAMVVKSLVQSGPADRAGLRQGDRIIAINSKKVENADDVMAFLDEESIGRRAAVKIIRESGTRELEVIPEELKD